MREGGLFDGKERPDLAAGGGDDPDRPGQDQQRHPTREGEDDAGDDHQSRPDHEDPPTAEPVGIGREPQRDERVADEREGQDQTDRERVEPGRGEIEDEDDREEPVAEHPQGSHREQEAAVPIEATQARDEPGIGRRGGHSRESRVSRARPGPAPGHVRDATMRAVAAARRDAPAAMA